MPIVNQTITKVFKGKSGEGKYGIWTKYDTYFDDGKKYVYFHSGDKPIPQKGMLVLYADVEETQKGEYTNYTLREIKFDSGAGKSETVKSSAVNADSKAYINHGEVIIRLMEKSHCEMNEFKRLIRLFNSGIDYLMKGEKFKVSDVTALSPKWEDDTPMSDPNDIPDSDIPF